MDARQNQNRWSLLLVDDDAVLCRMMQEFFHQLGHEVEYVHNGRDGLARALAGNFNLVVLDVMLPVVNGFTVLQQLRRRKSTPVILLTARGNPLDRIHGLNTGADDYLPKPFDPDELHARIRAVLRRAGKSRDFVGEGSRAFGDILVDFQSRAVWLGNQPVQLTALEFDILDLLVRSAGRVVTREELSASLLEREAMPYDRALDVHISHLRTKLECGHDLIRTIRGVGYVFTGAAGPDR